MMDGSGTMTALDPFRIADALRLAKAEWPEPAPKAAPAIGVASAWFAVETVGGGERDAVDDLARAGFQAYLPEMRKEVYHRRSRCTRICAFPLFNRCLFAELPSDNPIRRALDASRAVRTLFGMAGEPRPIAEADVRRFMSDQAALKFDQTREARIARGEIGSNRRETAELRFARTRRFRVVKGPWGGWAGEVEAITARGSIRAMMAIFGGLTPVEFSLDMVEPA